MITRRPAAIAAALGALLVPMVARAQAGKSHKLAVQVSSGDPATMILAMNNIRAAYTLYNERGEPAELELVCYGPGLTMLRDDTSPVKPQLVALKGAYPSLILSACHNTIAGREKEEGHPIPIIAEARVVPAGVVRLTELQEQGWSYIRP